MRDDGFFSLLEQAERRARRTLEGLDRGGFVSIDDIRRAVEPEAHRIDRRLRVITVQLVLRRPGDAVRIIKDMRALRATTRERFAALWRRRTA